MIAVTLNGEKKFLDATCNLMEAINNWGLGDSKFAIAVNQQFIPKAIYTETPINDGDSIELLVPMQGG